jgi:phosphate transport system substrate-binding protein
MMIDEAGLKGARIMSRFVFAVVAGVLLAAVLIQFAAVPLSDQELPTPTPLTPFPTLAPEAFPAALAADFPRVDGSTSAWPLLRLVACKINGIECFWLESFFGSEREILPALNPDPDSLEQKITDIRPSGTHGAYMNLIAGGTDLILVAREPSQDEIDAAENAGAMLDVQPVALDAFVFLVNVENPREDFTLDEIRRIYSGEITTWTELGVEKPLFEGLENLIQPYTRDVNSGSQELMVDLVMHETPMIDAPDMMVMTMMGLVSQVAWDKAGIGYSVFYYAAFLAPNPSIKLAAIEGVLPTSATIADDSYPLVTEVYVVVRADLPEDSPAVMLRDWLLAETGQALIAESGYVPVSEP